MTKSNTYIKIAGLLYLLVAMFLILHFPIIGGPYLALGATLLANSFLSTEELKKNKVLLIILAIVSLVFNLPAAVLIFICIGEITSVRPNSINSPPETLISTESKRIDMLLKIGLGMILVAGILFATQSWEFIGDLFKLIALIAMGGIFLGLSKFSEIKLKIESTTKAYFILGLSFFVLTWIGIGYFAPFSVWFSYAGEGAGLVYFITFLLAAAAFYLVNYKFKDKECLYIGHTAMYLSIFSILMFTKMPIMGVLLVMSIISTIVNFLPKTIAPSLHAFNEIVSFLYWPMIITTCAASNFYLLLAASFVNLFNILFAAARTNDNAQNLFAAIIGYILIFTSLINIPYDIDELLSVFIAITAFSLVIKYNPFTKNKFLIIPSQILYHFISVIIILVYLFSPSIEGMIITGVYLLNNIINSLDLNKTNDKVDFYYQPIVIFYLVASIIGYLDENVIAMDFVYITAICPIIYTFIHFISKKKETENYYFIYILIGTILSMLLNFGFQNIIVGVLTLLLSSYIYFQIDENKTSERIVTYILIAINLYYLPIFLLAEIYGSLLALLIFALLILVIRDKKLSIVNYIAIVAPLLTIIGEFGYEYEVYQRIATNALAMYVLFLALKFLVKDKEARDIVGTIVYALLTLSIIFEGELAFGIYIGVLAILIIFITINEEEYKKLFISGIAVVIVNIIAQLWEFWGQIPFWIYLLTVGISIVAFVTYIELRKSKEPPKKLTPQPQLSKQQAQPVEDVKPQEQATQEPTQRKEQPQPESVQQDAPQEKFKIVSEKTEDTTTEVGNFCPTCGTPNRSGGNFCSKCGRNLVIKK